LEIFDGGLTLPPDTAVGMVTDDQADWRKLCEDCGVNADCETPKTRKSADFDLPFANLFIVRDYEECPSFRKLK
jgi:hypothetical protein